MCTKAIFCILIWNETLQCNNVEFHSLPSSFLANLLWEESDLFSNIILNGTDNMVVVRKYMFFLDICIVLKSLNIYSSYGDNVYNNNMHDDVK